MTESLNLTAAPPRVESARKRFRRLEAAFTLPELLVVVGVIALLVAVLLPALAGGKKTAQMAKSMNNLKQIATWMKLYSSDNRETIVPSQFDYTLSAAPAPGGAGYPVKVRSDSWLGPNQYKGTWTDILWTYNDLGKSTDITNEGAVERYRYDSPDAAVYQAHSDYDENPFRSAAANSRGILGGTGATPFGNGTWEVGEPGYFAANNFFNTGSGPVQTWWVTGQIRSPDRSMYVVDSIAGETIEPVPAPFDSGTVGPASTLEVDFRYNGACLMLLLDGHVGTESAWTNLADLQTTRKIRVQNLNKN